MHKLLLSFLSISCLFYASSQYCMTSGPTQLIDSNLESLQLTGASGSINFVGCPGVTGVQEYLTETAYLNAGGNYTCFLQFGTCGNNFAGAGEAWIDFNIDGVFSPSESIGTWVGTPPTPMSIFNFTVPGGAFTGQSRMRVVQGENLVNPIDPCLAFTWGSTTDFSIYIQNGVDCSGYTGDDETDPRIVSSLPYSENHDNSICYSNQNPVYASPDVFYLVTPVPANGFTASLCSSSFDTFLSVMDPSGNIVSINDDHIDCGIQSKITQPNIGTDSLYVIVEGWGTNSGSYTINIDIATLNINDLNLSNFDLHPNPTHSTFQIGGDYQGEIRIVDYNGRFLNTQNVIKGEEINIENLNPGIYFVQFYVEGNVVSKKLIVQ